MESLERRRCGGVNEWINVSDVRGLHAFGEFVQFCVVKTLNIKT